RRVVHEDDHGRRAARPRQPLDDVSGDAKAFAAASDLPRRHQTEDPDGGESVEAGAGESAGTVDVARTWRDDVVDNALQRVGVVGQEASWRSFLLADLVDDRGGPHPRDGGTAMPRSWSPDRATVALAQRR